MRNVVFLSLGLVFMVGCVTSTAESIKSVSDNYKAVVFEDGISQQEAKIIAQKQLIKKNMVELYDLSSPQIDNDVAELPHHEDYWFVFFEEKTPGNIPFVFMVIINKGTGKIKFADDYNEESRWILEAALLH